MPDTNVESNALYGPGQDFKRAAGPPRPSWLDRAREQAAPVLDRARACRVLLFASVAAVAAALVALRRRKADDPVIDDSIAHRGDWHVTREPYRLDSRRSCAVRYDQLSSRRPGRSRPRATS
jgi:hypothetical protein